MAKTITTKYGTKINVDGLTPEQITKVRSMAEDKGAYGAKGAALAVTFQKTNASANAAAGAANTGNVAGQNTGGVVGGTTTSSDPAGTNGITSGTAANPATGGVDTLTQGGAGTGTTASGLTSKQQTRLAWLLKNRPTDPQVKQLQALQAKGSTTTGTTTTAGTTKDPGVTDTGNTYKTVDAFLDNAFSNLDPLDLSGAPKVLTADDLQGQRNSVYDSIYRKDTVNLEQNRARELEAQKQDLAQRGIPLNFKNDPNNKDNLYARAIGDVNDRYDAQDQSAKDSANIGADQGLATYVGANSTANDAFLKNATAGYQSKLDTISTTGNIIQDLMTKYGIDATTIQAKLNAATQKKIEADRNATALKAASIRSNNSNANDTSDVFLGS